MDASTVTWQACLHLVYNRSTQLWCPCRCLQPQLNPSAPLLDPCAPLCLPPHPQVPKSARSVLPTEEMVFIDIIEYDPSLLQNPPYTLHVRSEVPFLGSRVSTG